MTVYVDDDKFEQSEPCSEAEWKEFVLKIYHTAMSTQNIEGSCILSINLHKKPSNSHIKLHALLRELLTLCDKYNA
jgi:hypothetical protein